MRVRVFPGSQKILYYTYYLEGLYRLYGRHNVYFSTRDFPSQFTHGLGFILEDQEPRRVYISASDGPGLNDDWLAWCDVYGKVNFLREVVPEMYQPKVRAIGPSFGIQIWGLLRTLQYSVRLYALVKDMLDKPLDWFKQFWAQYKRAPLSAYVPGSSRSDYIFFASSLWKQEHDTNELRKTFIMAAKELPSVEFEGGSPQGTWRSIVLFFLRCDMSWQII